MFDRRSASGFVLSLVLSTIAAAQSTPPPAGSPADLHLAVVVTPKDGPPVGQLKQGDFTVLDNKRVQPITSFREADKDAPVQAIFVVDAVNIGVVTMAYERDELKKFLLANGGELAIPTSIAVLTDTGSRMQGGSTRDGKALSASLDSQATGLRSITRSTGIYGADERLGLSLTALQRMVDELATRPGRKLLIWLSPGWPLLSGPRIEELSRKEQNEIFSEVVNYSTRLRQAHITLYSVDPLGTNEPLQRRFYYEDYVKGVTKPGQVEAGNLALQVLVKQSGGLVLNGSNDLTAEMKRAVEDAQRYYEISFAAAPGEHPDEYHQVEVKVAQPGLVARTSQGYYAQPSKPLGVIPAPGPR